MAFVVSRPGERWEIRESYTTPAGPRSRTLAAFRVLTPQLIERAVRTARSPVDPDRLQSLAKRAGVPFESSPADAMAKSLLGSLVRGERLRPGLGRLLIDRLPGSARSVDESVALWIGASLKSRGSALLDLLELADRFPKPRKTPLRFPGLWPSRLKT